VANWGLSSLPRYILANDVEKVIASCDRATPVSIRDYAIVLMLARLGLRAGDLVRLRLSDIDWKGASISITGKGGRPTKFPLTREVGRAIVDYLEKSEQLVFSVTVQHIRNWWVSEDVFALRTE
jgi:integrase